MKVSQNRYFYFGIGFLGLLACSDPEVENVDLPEACGSSVEDGADCEMSYDDSAYDWIQFHNVDQLELACEEKCLRMGEFGFYGLEGLQELTGFNFVVETPGGSFSMHDAVRIDAFHQVSGVSGLTFEDNFSLEDIEPFASLEEVESGVSFRGNPKLKDLRALQNVRQIGTQGGPVSQGLTLERNGSLTTMKGLERLEIIYGRLRLIDQVSIESMVGLESLQEVDYFVITNPEDPNTQVELNSLAGLENLRRIHKTFTIENAPNLRRCEAEALIAQLEEPPEVVNLVNLSDELCD